jgi:hypothetical protein
MSMNYPHRSIVRVPPGQQPTETPECESSTGHSISTHDPVYAHDQWWNWVGLTTVALAAIIGAGFMIGLLMF